MKNAMLAQILEQSSRARCMLLLCRQPLPPMESGWGYNKTNFRIHKSLEIQQEVLVLLCLVNRLRGCGSVRLSIRCLDHYNHV